MTALVDPELQPSASYSVTIRAELSCQPGTLGRVATVIGHIGGDIDAIQIVKAGAGVVVRDFTVACRDEREGHKIAEHVGSLAGVQVLDVTDRTFELHQGGKIEVRGRVPVRGPDDLSMVYTPGVGRVSLAIKDDPRRQWTLTTKRNMVAVVTDGSAVLGLGDLGPAAAQPVMEGKCLLFKEFGGLDAFPICLATQDVDEIVATVERSAPVFGGVNLEDIAAPRCFEVEARLRQSLDIPVMHDDQHGTALVATGRSDYPNQINNSLGFPGIFRGALEVRATDINEAMKLAAAEAIAALIAPDELREDYIIPSMFDPRVAAAVAHATREAALATGAAGTVRVSG